MSSKSPKVDKETQIKLEEFYDKATKAAEEVLYRIFPTKILELQQMIDEASSPSSIFHTSNASLTDVAVHPPPPSSLEGPDVKKRKLENGIVENGVTSANSGEHARYPDLVRCNPHIKAAQDVIKSECETLVASCDKVKLWINLSMPKIEDGDNFGVQIQEEVLNEIHRSQESAYNLRDSCRQSHLNRGKMATKMIKYPHVEDYTLALKEYDDKMIYWARQNLFDIRNIYAVLNDILHKNINKIRSPKGNNSSGMY